MEVLMDKAWAGLDVAKESRRAHVLYASGRKLLSRELENGDVEISEFTEEALSLAKEVL
jgi:hypothetical protein